MVETEGATDWVKREAESVVGAGWVETEEEKTVEAGVDVRAEGVWVTGTARAAYIHQRK